MLGTSSPHAPVMGEGLGSEAEEEQPVVWGEYLDSAKVVADLLDVFCDWLSVYRVRLGQDSPVQD